MLNGVRLIIGRTFFKYVMKSVKMDKNLVNEIIECLPKERTLFRYFKDRYAFLLLQHLVGEGELVSEIRKSAYAPLLEKPAIKHALALAGQGILTAKILNSVWPGDTYHFLLTLGIWGSNCHRWDQTTRRGYNLVLQLNFSNQHDGIYKRMVKPEYELLLNSSSHPVLAPEDRAYFRETLSWARIDLDFQRDEALIEEVQCDWLREAKSLLQDAKWYKKKKRKIAGWWGTGGDIDEIIKYCEDVLSPYNQIWSEAMLAATIDFIRCELGIKNIYYHTESTGYKVKSIRYRKPPRSLYSQLPRKFCFSKSDEAPGFLYNDKYFRRIYNKVENPQWYKLTI